MRKLVVLSLILVCFGSLRAEVLEGFIYDTSLPFRQIINSSQILKITYNKVDPESDLVMTIQWLATKGNLFMKDQSIARPLIQVFALVDAPDKKQAPQRFDYMKLEDFVHLIDQNYIHIPLRKYQKFEIVVEPQAGSDIEYEITAGVGGNEVISTGRDSDFVGYVTEEAEGTAIIIPTENGSQRILSKNGKYAIRLNVCQGSIAEAEIQYTVERKLGPIKHKPLTFLQHPSETDELLILFEIEDPKTIGFKIKIIKTVKTGPLIFSAKLVEIIPNSMVGLINNRQVLFDDDYPTGMKVNMERVEGYRYHIELDHEVKKSVENIQGSYAILAIGKDKEALRYRKACASDKLIWDYFMAGTPEKQKIIEEKIFKLKKKGPKALDDQSDINRSIFAVNKPGVYSFEQGDIREVDSKKEDNILMEIGERRFFYVLKVLFHGKKNLKSVSTSLMTDRFEGTIARRFWDRLFNDPTFFVLVIIFIAFACMGSYYAWTLYKEGNESRGGFQQVRPTELTDRSQRQSPNRSIADESELSSKNL